MAVYLPGRGRIAHGKATPIKYSTCPTTGASGEYMDRLKSPSLRVR